MKSNFYIYCDTLYYFDGFTAKIWNTLGHPNRWVGVISYYGNFDKCRTVSEKYLILRGIPTYVGT